MPLFGVASPLGGVSSRAGETPRGASPNGNAGGPTLPALQPSAIGLGLSEVSALASAWASSSPIKKCVADGVRWPIPRLTAGKVACPQGPIGIRPSKRIGRRYPSTNEPSRPCASAGNAEERCTMRKRIHNLFCASTTRCCRVLRSAAVGPSNRGPDRLDLRAQKSRLAALPQSSSLRISWLIRALQRGRRARMSCRPCWTTRALARLYDPADADTRCASVLMHSTM
mmetsp:Transcript_34302/g.74936  ORF Transcript_34302/g.74936 Transcript_34302/m.74936 type:complete len:227 (-) Transcript_34302:146-826(-)